MDTPKDREFWFFYDQKTTVIGGFMENAGKTLYFRDIHMFVNRVKNLTIIKKDKVARDNLYICFKSKTFYWWNSVFSPKQKRLIKYKEKIEKWECHGSNSGLSPSID